MMAQIAAMHSELLLMKESISPDLIAENDNLDIESTCQTENGHQRIHETEAEWLTDTNIYDGDCENFTQTDPYDNFMTRHLQQYGYFTGRNASFRNKFDELETWRRNYDLRLSGTQSLSVEEQQKKMGHYQSGKNTQLDPGFGQFFVEGQPPDELLSRTTQLVFHYQAGKKVPKLREPRNLYALTKKPGPQQATRWPSHMQVICPPIRFMDYTPAAPDPFYVPTGNESTYSVRGATNGEVVYFNDPGGDMYFMRSRVAGCRMAMSNISLTPRESADEENLTLEFESRFESGNLLKAVKINDFDYELTLRPDLYTEKHTQWYFFRVRNMVPSKTYRLTIVNLMKPSSLYNSGMKPLFYSEIEAKKNKIGWTRAGSDIRYYRNNLYGVSGQSFYSLTWTINFPHKDDTCYFAHCYPYTYTDLQEYLLKLANDPVRSKFCKQRVLCRTLAGNLVYIITVTSPSRNPEIARAKKAVVITARVHPGETNASWMMKGFLDFLSGNSADAKLLRDNFIFKIAPMLNPDGVVVGNYRCSLAGRDLNRNYKSVLKDSFPSVWHVKMMVKRLNMEREVVMYCDLHGHSRKNNIFIYGCENKRNPKRKLRERIFPLMLSKNSDTKFTYESCKFKVQKSKQGTGRVVMWCMGIMNSYTMEATFGGTSLGSKKGTHFSTKDLEEMGHDFCDTLLDYCDPDASKVKACYQEIQDRVKKQILRKMQMRNMPGSLGDVDIDDYSSEYESDTSGSDSSCDDGLPVHLLAIAPKLRRKRRLKTKRDRNKQTTRKSAPAPEEPKPVPIPSHGARSQAEKPPKSTKRKEDIAALSADTVAQNPVFQTDEKLTKKGKSLHTSDIPSCNVNKATVVHLAPHPNDQQQKPPRQQPWQRETEKHSRQSFPAGAPATPWRIRRISFDDNQEDIDFKTAPELTYGIDSSAEQSHGDFLCQVAKRKVDPCVETQIDFVDERVSDVSDSAIGTHISSSILKIPSRVKVPENANASEWVPTSARKNECKGSKVNAKKAASDDTTSEKFERSTTKFRRQKKLNRKQSLQQSQTETSVSCSKRLSRNLPVIKPAEQPRKQTRGTKCSNAPRMHRTRSTMKSLLQSSGGSATKMKLPRGASKIAVNSLLKTEQQLVHKLQKTYKLSNYPEVGTYCVCFHLPAACQLCRR